jgi:hypothetical protein
MKRCCWEIRLAALIIALSIGATAVAQSDPSLIELAAIGGAGWSANGVTLTVDLAATSGPAVDLRAREIRLLDGTIVVTDLRIQCAGFSVNLRHVRCPNSRYSFTYGGAQRGGQIELEYRAREGTFSGVFPQQGAGSGTLTLSLRDIGGETQLSAVGSELLVSRFAPYLQPLLATMKPSETNFELADGTLSFTVRSEGRRAPHLNVQMTLQDLAFSNTSGELAGEALDVTLEADAHRDFDGQRWTGNVAFALEQGGLYAEPVYLDIDAQPLSGSSQFRYESVVGALELMALKVEQRDVLRLHGRARGTFADGLEQMLVEIDELKFPAAYETWLAGLLVGTPLAALDVDGALSASFAMDAGQASTFTVQLGNLNVEDRDGRFAIYDLGGEINWARDGANLSASEINAQGGFVYGAGFDAIALELGIAGEAIDLLAPAHIPLLGGALKIDSFSLRDYGSDDLSLGFEAQLEPIDLGQLTVALNWPAFAGTLAGRLPHLRYSHGVVTLGGNLEARAFDGDISIEGLRVEQPFGIVPAVSASIRMRNLDLEQVTEVVPFGRVSGRLDGDIENLRLLKGEPIAFNARFATPVDDDSRHRLSQRAVETISRVAGGGAVLSTTFLRIFKNFAYDKLGISCRLENDVCHMGGVEPSDDGYYIVKGALAPRVDLIGRVRKVQWSRLMSQLERALNDGEFKID